MGGGEGWGWGNWGTFELGWDNWESPGIMMG